MDTFALCSLVFGVEFFYSLRGFCYKSKVAKSKAKIENVNVINDEMWYRKSRFFSEIIVQIFIYYDR